MNPIYIDDAVAAIVAALAVDGHKIVNVAGDEIVTIRQIAEAAGRAVGVEPVFEDGGGQAAGDVIGDTTAVPRRGSATARSRPSTRASRARPPPWRA